MVQDLLRLAPPGSASRLRTDQGAPADRWQREHSQSGVEHVRYGSTHTALRVGLVNSAPVEFPQTYASARSQQTNRDATNKAALDTVGACPQSAQRRVSPIHCATTTRPPTPTVGGIPGGLVHAATSFQNYRMLLADQKAALSRPIGATVLPGPLPGVHRTREPGHARCVPRQGGVVNGRDRVSVRSISPHAIDGIRPGSVVYGDPFIEDESMRRYSACQ